MLQYNQYPVPAKLKHLIRYYWSYDACGPENIQLHIKSFADRFPRLIFQDKDNFNPIFSEDNNEMSYCYLSGIDNKPTDAFWSSAFSHFGVSFYPQALHVLFKIDASELTNQIIDLKFLGHNNLTEKLRLAKQHSKKVEILNEFFLAKLNIANQDEIVNNLLFNSWLKNEKSNHSFAMENKISERQLQRRFKQSVGLSMKNYAKVLRFERVLKLLPKATFGDLTSIAYELNYADQAHFIKDFKSFSGLTPLQFIQENNLGSESSSFIFSKEE